MSDTAIIVENLGKKYFLGKKNTGKHYKTLQEEILSLPGKLFSKNTDSQEFWALKNISFEVKKGEVLGIIGRNGAGKSTLLKILSRITDPTEGRVDIYGRVGSLLEVGTGFHPELTGRENIYLSGAILGLKRWEIRKKFDEIVEFAEISEFIDTPAKRYSSGMYMRLAFAVAAHLEPEILVVDEVLAVGDMEFQKKCLGKMEEVSRGGRTVLFVSHNMLAIKTLCTKGLLISSGKSLHCGELNTVINSYSDSTNDTQLSSVILEKESSGIIVKSLRIVNSHDGTFNINEPLTLESVISVKKSHVNIHINLFFSNLEGVIIFITSSKYDTCEYNDYCYQCEIPANTLNDIRYSLSLMVVENKERAIIDMKDIMTIRGVEQKRDSAWLGKYPGLIRPEYYQWNRIKL